MAPGTMIILSIVFNKNIILFHLLSNILEFQM